ncbi:TPA: arginase family protein [Staphylococcus aureus]
MTKKKGIDIIGVPSTFGQRKLGVDLGPTAIRYAGLIPRLKQLDLDVNDKGDIKVSAVDIEKFQSEQNGLRNYDEIIDVTQKLNVDGVHLSLDVDALDPLETPGTGTRVLGGLTYRESHFALELLHQSQSVTSMDLVEVNPLIDHNNHTAEQSVSLVGTFFGETLL